MTCLCFLFCKILGGISSLVSMYLVHSRCFFLMSLTVLFSSGVDLLELSARGLCGLTGVYFASAACIASFGLFHFSPTVKSDKVSLLRSFFTFSRIDT